MTTARETEMFAAVMAEQAKHYERRLDRQADEIGWYVNRCAKLEVALAKSNERHCGDCGCSPKVGDSHAPDCSVAEALRP